MTDSAALTPPAEAEVLPQAARWKPLGETIDALITTDLTARGISTDLYRLARAPGAYPLAMGTALKLQNTIKRGDVVLVCTGWPSRSWLMRGITETDGPVGAAYLCRFLEQCFGAVPIIVTEESIRGVSEVALRASGLILADLDTALRSKAGKASAAVGTVLPFTTDWDEAQSKARELMAELKPAAVLSVETPGASETGEFHNVTGRLVPSELVVKADALMRVAREMGIFTVGIGDGGNELGMGSIAEGLRALPQIADGAEPSTPVDSLIVGCISNWAAIGLGAAMAAVSGKPELVAQVDVNRITDRVSDAGAIDGLTAYVDPKQDGTEPDTNVAFMNLLHTAVRMHSSGWNKG